MGLCGLLGTFAISHVLKTRLYSLLIGTPFLMMVIALALIYFGYSLSTVVVLLSMWGFVGTAVPVAWWTWLAQTLPHEAEAGGGLMVAIIQLAITLGASIGGLFFLMHWAIKVHFYLQAYALRVLCLWLLLLL